MLSFAPKAVAADSADAAAPPYVARNVSEFWNPPADGRQKRQPIDLRATIYYYDPDWKLLWAEGNDGPSWFDNGGKPLPMRSGDSVRITGTFVPAAGIDGSTVKVTVLQENVWPVPLVVLHPFVDADKYDARWVSAEGYVCRQIEHDPSHIQLDLVIDDRDLVIYLRIGSTDPVPQLAGCKIQANFLFVSKRDGQRRIQHIEGFVPAARLVTVVGHFEDDPGFHREATPIESLGSHAGERVRIVGEVRQLDPGHMLAVRDATGQITIHTEQPIDFRVGDTVEVVGDPSGSGLELTLKQTLCRHWSPARDSAKTAVGNAGAPAVKLRVAAQVAELRPDEAAGGVEATLRGVVTWSDSHVDFFYLQDQSGGVRVHYGNRAPAVGSVVVVDGKTTEGPIGPLLDASHCEAFSVADLPEPARVALEDLFAGSQEAQRVSLEGFLRAMDVSGPWRQLFITTATGEALARLPADAAIDIPSRAKIRVVGVCATGGFDARGKFATSVLVASPADVVVLEDPPHDLFQSPLRTVDGVLRMPVSRVISGPVRVRGTVALYSPGQYLYLQEGGASIMVLSRAKQSISAGDGVEIVGVPGREGPRVVLRDAVVRPLNMRRELVPTVLPSPRLDARLDGTLVRLEGIVQDADRTGNSRWSIRTQPGRFDAWADHPLDVGLAEGARVAFSGVYRMEYDEYRQPRAFTLQLRDERDVLVVRAAPWLTGRRALVIVACFAGCVLLGLAWVIVLRRRVRSQTEQIRRQLETESRLNAELERANRLESLGVLAGGIAHDFNNLLTVITANIGLAAMDDRVREAAGDLLSEAERGARRAADITQQLLTFARGGDPVRTAVALPDVVREAAQFASHGARTRCVFENAADLPPAEVDRAQIGRVVHNLVLNAVQAMQQGGTIRIGLSSVEIRTGAKEPLKPGCYVKLTVADDGPGISQEHLARIFEPYFSTKQSNNGLGLATVHSIVKKHQGHIEVRSADGDGTTFEVLLPAATKPAQVPAPPTAVSISGQLRILFMDDEEVIRRMAAKAMKQLGHSCVVVADGMAAVREYEKSLQAGARFDAVVLDLTVPGGVGGRAAIELLRRIDPSVRAIVSSGYSSDPVLANFLKYGFCAIVAKPYTVEDLARTLNEAVQRGRGVNQPLEAASAGST